MIGLSKFQNNGGVVPGGVKVLQYLPIDDIETYPLVIQNLTDIILKTGKAWLQAPVLPKISHKAKESKTKQGSFVEQQIAAKMPDSLTLASELHVEVCEMQEHRFIVLITNRLGGYEVVGTKEQPLKFGWSYNTGDDFSGFIGYNLRFFGKTFKKSIHIQP